MRGLFHPDSKLMQVLGFVADLFLLNMLFLLCCVPIFTIGAAQAGLHSAARILQDPQDDRSVYKAFFRGFKDGFGRVTVAWVLVLLLVLITFYTLVMAWSYAEEGIFIPWPVPLILLCPLLVYHAMVPLLHSQFGCTLSQLLKNCLLMLIWHPIASLGTGILVNLPAVMFLVVPELTLQLGLLFIAAYFSLAFMFAYLLTRKAFKTVIDEFNREKE